jgi:thioesterase domain-containing protein
MSLPLATVFRAPTIEKMATLLRGTTTQKWSTRVVAIKPEGNLPPFLCIDAGSLFRPLAKGLSSDQPFLGLRLDTGGLPTHFSMTDIAAYHVATIREIQPEGPYYLGGWSAAGLVAYEVAQLLRSQDQEVALLVLFDVTNTAALRPSSKWHSLREQFYFLTWKVQYDFKSLRRLKKRDRWPYLRDLFRQLRLDLSHMLWVMADRIQRRANRRLAVAPREPNKAMFVAANDYRPRPYAGPVLLFRCGDQSTRPYYDPKLGWEDLLGDGLEIFETAGDHKDMFLEPNVGLLANELDRALVEARASAEPTLSGKPRS